MRRDARSCPQESMKRLQLPQAEARLPHSTGYNTLYITIKIYLYNNYIYYRTREPWNMLSWKGPVGSSSPTPETAHRTEGKVAGATKRLLCRRPNFLRRLHLYPQARAAPVITRFTPSAAFTKDIFGASPVCAVLPSRYLTQPSHTVAQGQCLILQMTYEVLSDRLQAEHKMQSSCP